MKADNLELSDQCREVSGLTPEGLGKAEPLDRVLQQVRCCSSEKGLFRVKSGDDTQLFGKRNTLTVFHFEVIGKLLCL